VTVVSSIGKVFPFRAQRASAKVRLFCLPFAGGAANAFRQWSARLPEYVDVCPVELPGRGVRSDEPPIHEMLVLRDMLVEAMEPLLDLPAAIFGHSMGARIGFTLADVLGPRVCHLFASASRSPDRPRGKPLAKLSDSDLIEEMRVMGGTPKAILDEPDLMRLALPIVRADFAIVESHLAPSDARVSCPITGFAGTKDATVTLEDARKWEPFTTSTFRFVEVPHAHFYLDAASEQLTREIGTALDRLR
jgi:medium-chain acyl-[acyl-carrier-protein] hydrolase